MAALEQVVLSLEESQLTDMKLGQAGFFHSHGAKQHS